MQAGSLFYNKSITGVPSHPWIIISDPELDADDVLIVNFTDADSHHDTTCMLTPDEFGEDGITKKSCVAYQFGKVTSIAKLSAAESRGLIFNKRQASEELLTFVRQGAHDSDETKGEHRELLRSQGLID